MNWTTSRWGKVAVGPGSAVSIRVSASLNWALSLRMVALAPSEPSCGRRAAAALRDGATLRAATPFLRRFAAPDAVALILFLVGILVKT